MYRPRRKVAEMAYLYCSECGEIFHEDDSRKVIAEDGRTICACPNCRCTELDEAEICERCGEPIPPAEHFCEDCKETLYRQVEGIIEDFIGDYMDAKEKFLDYIEREWM